MKTVNSILNEMSWNGFLCILKCMKDSNMIQCVRIITTVKNYEGMNT